MTHAGLWIRRDKETGSYSLFTREQVERVLVGNYKDVAAKQPWEMTYREYKRELKKAAYETKLEPSAPGQPPNEVERLKAQIGDEGIFYRSGELPKTGRSRNAVTGQLEQGVSAYPTPFASSLAGLSGRQWYTGKGRIVAIGSDGEPIIRPTGKWEKVGSEGYEPLSDLHETSIRQALSEGKPVPPEVLAEYPDLAAKYRPPPATSPPPPIIPSHPVQANCPLHAQPTQPRLFQPSLLGKKLIACNLSAEQRAAAIAAATETNPVSSPVADYWPKPVSPPVKPGRINRRCGR